MRQLGLAGHSLPDGWQSIPAGYLFRREKRTNFVEEPLLSVYRDHGVVLKNSRDDNFNKASEDLSKYQLVEANDLVINKMKAWQGSVGISSHRGIVSPAYFVASPTRQFSRRYVHYLLRCSDYLVEYQTRSGGIRVNQWDLDWDDFRRIPVTLPSTEKQERIANFLDEKTTRIDALIAEKERLVEKLDELHRSAIWSLVTKGGQADVEFKKVSSEWIDEVPSHWQVKKIKWMTSVLRGASPRPIDDPKYFDDVGEYAWVRIADVSASSDGYLKSTDQQLSQLGAASSVKREPGDLFLSIAGTVGKPCIAEIKCCIHDGFVWFPNLGHGLLRDWFFNIFLSGFAYAGLGKMGTQLNLNTETVGNIEVPLPPDAEMLELLKQIQEKKLANRTLQTHAIEHIARLREYRSSLISAAVTGQLELDALEVGA